MGAHYIVLQGYRSEDVSPLFHSAHHHSFRTLAETLSTQHRQLRCNSCNTSRHSIRNIHSWALSLLWQTFECSLWPQLGQRLETKRTCTFSWPTTEGWKEFMAVTQPIAMILPVTMTMLTTMKMMMKMVMMMVRLDQQQGLGAIYGSNPTAPKAGHSASICNICTSNTMAQCTCTVYSNSSTSSIRH